MSETLTIYTDGGSRGNPGPSACGIWIPSYQAGRSRFLGTATNNEAEYQGLLLALGYAIEQRHPDILIKSDSKLIVNQVSGVWSIKFPHLQALKDKVDESVAELTSFSIEYVPRAQNAEADRECNECMDREAQQDPTRFLQ